jgi:hypothetical protein
VRPQRGDVADVLLEDDVFDGFGGHSFTFVCAGARNDVIPSPSAADEESRLQ